MGKSDTELIRGLERPRIFLNELGKGAANVLRTNDYSLIGPRDAMPKEGMDVFARLLMTNYEMPLHYDLLLQALANLQRTRDYRLAIVHAETAFEVYIRASLKNVLVALGCAQAEAENLIENDEKFWGIKKQLRRLDESAQEYAKKANGECSAFVGGALFQRWDKDLYSRRNRAVHAGMAAFTYGEASAGIGVAKEAIVFLEKRMPTLANLIELNPSMAQFAQNSGEVVF